MTQQKKNLGGRPTKKTDERVEILLECLRDAMPIKRACEFAQVDHQTFYNWLKKDEGFSIQVAFARAHAVRRLISAVTAQNPWKILKSIDPEHFTEDITIREDEPSGYENESDDDLEKAAT